MGRITGEKFAGRVLSLLALMTMACGEANPHVQAATVPASSASPETSAFPGEDRPLARFHSKRFALSLPLPDGSAWRIDDHTARELLATNAPTRSKLTFYEWIEPELMNRTRCEKRARELNLVSDVELQPLEDVTIVGPEAYDTRLLTGTRPSQGSSVFRGDVLAFGAYVRKCLFFHFETEASSPEVLASRLAFARVRIFGGITFDAFDDVRRETHGR